MSDPISLNVQLETEFGPSERLDLNEEWIAYLDQSAEIPSCVDGIDPSIDYSDDDTALA